MAITQEAVQAAIEGVIDPNTQKDYVSTRALKNLAIEEGRVSFDIELGYPAKTQLPAIRAALSDAVSAVPGVIGVNANVAVKIAAHAVQHGLKPLPGVKNIIAVASGKGGVGKSTTAVNLALALSDEGASVGLLDADIYGPSVPQMLGLTGRRPETEDGRTLEPLRAFGLQAMSIGFMVDIDSPMVWRGPMVTQALEQLLGQTRWRELDYLVVDMPPGTGDTQLTLAQKVPVTGALIVTTPQDIALIDARKGLKMFEKVGIPILGLIENMSVHVCPKCGHEEPIFGAGGAQRMAGDYGVEVLGALPLELAIRELTDAGKPTVVGAPRSRAADIYRVIARRVGVRIAERARDMSAKFPKIVFQRTEP
ncbi:MAG: iron-sulfur cluster carrier protein ApbC [Candidatus Accumulibacter sp.]|jgi:ATP-binding protein involved in chromosome partitioning|nr:iron-sulfur cluster carrier protein ApbC [Accumulibacter sp.]